MLEFIKPKNKGFTKCKDQYCANIYSISIKPLNTYMIYYLFKKNNVLKKNNAYSQICKIRKIYPIHNFG